jgi:GAF domain-containing protein
MIERERAAAHGDPEDETRLWLNRLAEVDRKRSRYQAMAAEDLISFDELRARMAELEETRRTADRQLRDLRNRQEQLRSSRRTGTPCSRTTPASCRRLWTSWTPRSVSTSTGCSGWRPRLPRTGRSKSAGML